MQTIAQWAYNMYFGLPLVAWLGIITYIFLLCTGAVMVLTRKKIKRFPLNVHITLARITIILATVHFIFGISSYI
ncbi:MAG: hypothetical protein ACOCZY_02300 [Bacillota bacterium]